MGALRKVKVDLPDPIVLDDDGLADLLGEMQQALAEGDEGTYLCHSVTLEVEPAPKSARIDEGAN